MTEEIDPTEVGNVQWLKFEWTLQRMWKKKRGNKVSGNLLPFLQWVFKAGVTTGLMIGTGEDAPDYEDFGQ